MNLDEVPAALRYALADQPDSWAMTPDESARIRHLVELALAKRGEPFGKVAKAAGISRATLHNFIGGRNATWRVAVQLAKALKITGAVEEILLQPTREVFDVKDETGVTWRIYRADEGGII